MALNEEREFESRIGKGAKISGKLVFRASAKIEGEADGEITGDEIVIAEGAVVTARITGSRVTVAGRVSGEIVARERLELLPTARLKCTITRARNSTATARCRRSALRPDPQAGIDAGVKLSRRSSRPRRSRRVTSRPSA